MLSTLLKPEILELIQSRDWSVLREILADSPPQEVVDLILDLPKADRVFVFRALPRDLAAEAFSHLALEEQDALLRDLTDGETRHLLADLPPDDRTGLLEELPGQATQRLLNLLDPGDLEEARWLLGYPEESVGRLMTPDYVAVRPEWTVDQALSHIRRFGHDRETINRIFIVDEGSRLLDDVELRWLIFEEPEARVEDVMDHSFASVAAFEDRELAVSLVRKYDQTVLPVLDSGGVLLGIVTVDDLLDVQEAEVTEDFHLVGSVEPLRQSFRDASLGFLYRRRIGWLIGLVFVNVFSAGAIAVYLDTIETVVALTIFLPLLIGSGGNAGAQASTLMVRALATGDVDATDWFRLLGRELAVAAAIGVTMSAAVAAVGAIRAPEVLLVVSLTMFIVVLLGSLIGMSMPFLLTRIGADPAVASAPLITSIADVTGVVVYFTIANWYLGLG
ncbi:MAG: magnesium transporter [Gemmatimonas sp.]|nr:magnesium transporter [Gemmatimonas sp.]